MEKTKNKRRLTGIVVSDKSDKTIVVKVESKKQHPLYGKIVKSHKKFHAHDEENKYKIGDEVVIEESKPISKKKKWIVISGENN
jgi:small subunit ribosomal protein S17